MRVRPATRMPHEVRSRRSLGLGAVHGAAHTGSTQASSRLRRLASWPRDKRPAEWRETRDEARATPGKRSPCSDARRCSRRLRAGGARLQRFPAGVGMQVSKQHHPGVDARTSGGGRTVHTVDHAPMVPHGFQLTVIGTALRAPRTSVEFPDGAYAKIRLSYPLRVCARLRRVPKFRCSSSRRSSENSTSPTPWSWS